MNMLTGGMKNRLKKEHSYDGVIDIKKGDFIVVNNDFFILKALF